MRNIARIPLIFTIVLLHSIGWSGPKAVAAGTSLIRDSEIERIIRAYSTPIFKAAGLKASDVKIFIVKDNSLNAFVAGGQKMFINTGLILNSDSANQIIGVIAHETGHIAGGHLSRVHDALSKSSTSTILSAIIGGAAAVATGRGDVGAAIALGGQISATRNFLAYSRTQEASADHAALSYLDKTGQSARGLMEFMQKLGDQELLSPAQQDPYVRSHPLTRDRITTVENHVQNSDHSENPSAAGFERMHGLMKAKLYAFLNPYGRTIRVYKASDQSVNSRYARAIGEYRRQRLDLAAPLIDGLIREFPDNPYFLELKGQMLFEHGRIQDAIIVYTRANQLLPDAPLIRRDLARAQLESKDPTLYDDAVDNLEAALFDDRESAFNWHFLAIAHGRRGDMGRSSLALAEEALLKGKPEVAKFHAGRAAQHFTRGSREWLQSEDIRLAAAEQERAQKRRQQQQ